MAIVSVRTNDIVYRCNMQWMRNLLFFQKWLPSVPDIAFSFKIKPKILTEIAQTWPSTGKMNVVFAIFWAGLHALRKCPFTGPIRILGKALHCGLAGGRPCFLLQSLALRLHWGLGVCWSWDSRKGCYWAAMLGWRWPQWPRYGEAGCVYGTTMNCKGLHLFIKQSCLGDVKKF